MDEDKNLVAHRALETSEANPLSYLSMIIWQPGLLKKGEFRAHDFQTEGALITPVEEQARFKFGAESVWVDCRRVNTHSLSVFYALTCVPTSQVHVVEMANSRRRADSHPGDMLGMRALAWALPSPVVHLNPKRARRWTSSSRNPKSLLPARLSYPCNGA